jgi:hypothetical protein
MFVKFGCEKAVISHLPAVLSFNSNGDEKADGNDWHNCQRLASSLAGSCSLQVTHPMRIMSGTHCKPKRERIHDMLAM